MKPREIKKALWKAIDSSRFIWVKPHLHFILLTLIGQVTGSHMNLHTHNSLSHGLLESFKIHLGLDLDETKGKGEKGGQQ